MKKIAIIIVLIIVLILSACIVWRTTQKPKSQQKQLTLYGNVDIRTAQLAFDGEALVTVMNAEEGTRVKSGDVLATLDASRIKAELDEARANVSVQEAVARRMENGMRKQEIEQARARVASAEALLANAQQDLIRITETTASGASSQQLFDGAKAQVSVKQAELEEMKQALSLALEGSRQEDIDEARSRLEESRAHVKLLEDRLADTELRAPFTGTIRSRLMEPGDYAIRGRTAYTLAMTDPKWIRAYVPEPSLGRVRLGARAWITSDSFSGKVFDGWVGFISPIAEFTPKSVETTDLRTQLVYEVRIYVKDPQDQLRLGMPTTVIVGEESTPSASPVLTVQAGIAPVDPNKE